MKKLFFISVFASAVFSGAAQNLVQNGTFDSAGVAHGSHWYDYCQNEIIYLHTVNYPSCFVTLEGDAPPAAAPGDTTCVHPAVGPPGGVGVRTFITGQSGTLIYQLQYWMKSLPEIGGLQSYGGAAIGICSGGQFNPSQTVYYTNTAWQQYTLIDTLTTLPTDSIYIELSSPGPDFYQQHNLFDLIELTVIDTLTTLHTGDVAQRSARVYPVPADDKVIIELPGMQNAGCTISLYNAVGQCVRTVTARQPQFLLEREKLEPGIYFFTVQEKDSGKTVAQGKVIFE